MLERTSRRSHDDRGDVNPGNNLHVSGVGHRVTDRELEEAFAKFGRAQVMYDPHSREPRGFAFVTMADADAAEAAISGMTGVELMGRTLSVQKARRGRARTPTPGRYFGPPKGRGESIDAWLVPSRWLTCHLSLLLIDEAPGGGRYGPPPYDRYGPPPPRDPYDRYGPPRSPPPRDPYDRYGRPPPRDYPPRDYPPPGRWWISSFPRIQSSPPRGGSRCSILNEKYWRYKT
ncbi:hypothetical protein L7F22_042517 [Adiantum nelumboides]|nr:hypothetical protein [Adiantum nelumboides]